jgi:hypothetical protein
MSPVGLLVKTVVETHHSIAFFNPLGILKIYSGVQISIPSVLSMLFLKAMIDEGGLSA